MQTKCEHNETIRLISQEISVGRRTCFGRSHFLLAQSCGCSPGPGSDSHGLLAMFLIYVFQLVFVCAFLGIVLDFVAFVG